MHVPFSDAPTFKIGSEWVGLGRLLLALWPLQTHLARWRRMQPGEEMEDAIDWIFLEERLTEEARDDLLQATLARLEMLTSGHLGCPVPGNLDEFKAWWRTTPPP